MQSDFDKWFSTTKQGDSASFDQGTFTRLGDNMASFVSSSGAVDYLRANEGLLDIAKRLDPQSLAAAKLAIQTFTAEPQPDDAVNVAAPAGGWDNAPAQTQANAAKPAAKSKRTAPVTATH